MSQPDPCGAMTQAPTGHAGVRVRRRAVGRAVGVVGLALSVAGLSAACTDDAAAPTSTGETSQGATKTGDGTQRHDLDPLTSRISALQGVTDATWYSGTLGSPDAPGPSLSWIDAVVTLPSGAADELRTLDLTTATDVPDVVADLISALPDGELLAGAELDEAFSHEGWRSTAYLSARGDQVVLVIVGE